MGSGHVFSARSLAETKKAGQKKIFLMTGFVKSMIF
jgi:hypothetical protein